MRVTPCRAALSAFLQRTSPHPASPLPRAAELAVAAESLQQQLAAHYSPAIDYSALYSVFLHGPSGWSRTPQAVPPQPAAQQSGQRAGGAQGSGSGLAGRTTALVVAVAVAVVALVAAAGYVGVKRRWQPCRGLKPKPRLSWRSDAPGAGPRTTLLVTGGRRPAAWKAWRLYPYEQLWRVIAWNVLDTVRGGRSGKPCSGAACTGWWYLQWRVG